jgi:hypothetical protein
MKLIRKYGALIVAALALFFYLIIEVRKTIDLKENENTSVAKVYMLIRDTYVYSQFRYEYYYKGKRYTVQESLMDADYKEIINQYFEVKFSKANPENSEINLKHKISDSLRISNAGFKKAKHNSLIGY